MDTKKQSNIELFASILYTIAAQTDEITLKLEQQHEIVSLEIERVKALLQQKEAENGQ
jgi:hypothetical protein